MRTLGEQYPFHERPLSEIAEFLGRMSDKHSEFQHMTEVVKSIRRSPVREQLACSTSMHDLLVVATPIPDPPYSVIRVRAPSSLDRPQRGSVVIEHTSLTGRQDSIQRPARDAVPVFWRFVSEKLGVSVNARTRSQGEPT